VADQEAADPAELYAVEPAEFTAARNAMAKRLKAEGRAEEAAEVSRRRRPTPTAWALNQVARRRPDLLEALAAAGGRLRQASAAAVGGDRSGLAEAQAAERAAVRATVDAAVEFLGARATDAARRKLGDTLRAAVMDPAVADLVSRGVLETDMDASGFGLVPPGAAGETGPASSPAPQPAPQAADGAGGAVGPARAAPSRRDAAPGSPTGADGRRREAERRALTAERDRLTRQQERLQRALAEAEERAHQLREELAAGRAELEAVESRLAAPDP